MANRYWVGGTASWDGTAGTKWALTSGGAGGQAIPTTADDVFFDAASGANTVTIATGNTGCKSITCTGFTGTLTGSADLSIAGGFTFSAGMTSTLTGRFLITASGTLTSAGKTLPNLIINGNGITVNQNDAFTFTSTPVGNTYAIQLTTGTYNTNNFNITFSLSGNSGGGIDVRGSSVRTLNLGSSNISFTVVSNNNVPYFDASGTIANFTFNAGTSTITCTATSAASATASFQGGGLTFNNVTFANASTTVMPINGTNTFANVTFTGRTTAGVSPYSFSANQTITGTLTASAGTDATMRTFLYSSVAGTACTLTSAAVSLTDTDFQDITGAGAASWTGTRLGDCKGNSNITFPTGASKYWNLAAGGNWGGAIAWATTGGGTPNINNFPLAQDTAVFQSTGLNSGATVTINTIYNIGSIDMSARTSNTMTLATGTTTPTVYGSWTNGTGTTLSGAGRMTIGGRVSQSITSAGKTFTQLINLNSLSGTLTLQDALTLSQNVSGVITLTNGTLDLNGKTCTSTSNGTFLTAAGTKNLTFNGGSLVIAGTGTGFNNAAPTGFTTTAGTGTGSISMTSASAKTFAGGGSTFNCALNQGGAGALTVTSSNAFNDITNTYSATGATTITFTASTTQTVSNFTATGALGKILTINSSSAGTQATLSKASGTVNANYLSIQDSNATGGATWNAGANSVNVSNNTGWIFGFPGNFFLLF